MRKLPLVIAFISTVILIGLIYVIPQSAYPPSQLKPVQRKDCCSGQPYGAIEGYIYDTEGKPVAFATAHAERIDAIMTMALDASSDKTGKFTIKWLPPGRYKVSGSKEKDGFPITTSTFYYSEPIAYPEVTVYEQQVTSDVKVTLGPRVGKLILHITDAETHKPIGGTEITLRHANNPNYFFSTSGDEHGNKFEILAPTVPFTVELSAPGYEKKRLGPLHLKQEEIKRLDISLNPVK